jgi:hypothetical protein
MKSSELKQMIDKLEKGINSPATDERFKPQMRKKLEALKAELKEAEAKGKKPEPKAEKKTSPKKGKTKAKKPAKKETPAVAEKKEPVKAEKKLMTLEECEEIISQRKVEAKKVQEYRNKREKKGLPPETTVPETTDKAAKAVDKKIEKNKKPVTIQQADAVADDIVSIVDSIKGAMKTKEDGKKFVKDLIAELQKLI